MFRKSMFGNLKVSTKRNGSKRKPSAKKVKKGIEYLKNIRLFEEIIQNIWKFDKNLGKKSEKSGKTRNWRVFDKNANGNKA